MCVMCMWVIEGQLNLTRVSGAGGSGFPGQGATALAIGTPKPGGALAQRPHFLKRAESSES